jgi:hypothetical protein
VGVAVALAVTVPFALTLGDTGRVLVCELEGEEGMLDVCVIVAVRLLVGEELGLAPVLSVAVGEAVGVSVALGEAAMMETSEPLVALSIWPCVSVRNVAKTAGLLEKIHKTAPVAPTTACVLPSLHATKTFSLLSSTGEALDSLPRKTLHCMRPVARFSATRFPSTPATYARADATGDNRFALELYFQISAPDATLSANRLLPMTKSATVSSGESAGGARFF